MKALASAGKGSPDGYLPPHLPHVAARATITHASDSVTLTQFRPRSATELVDAAVQLARRHYRPLLLLSAVVAIPNLLIGLLAQFVAPQQRVAGAFAPEDMAIFPLAVVSMAWFAISLGALILSTSAAYVEGRALEPMDALRRALARAGALIAGNLVAFLLVFLIVLGILFLLMVVTGLVMAIVGAMPTGLDETFAAVVGLGAVAFAILGFLVIGSRYVNVTASVVLEQRGGIASIRRSRELVRGRLLATAGFVAVVAVLWLAAYLTFMAIGALVLRSTELAANLASFLVLVLYPFLGALLTLLYYDLRIRKEGYDIELMAQAIEHPPASAPAPEAPR